jgi:hypothetical protein
MLLVNMFVAQTHSDRQSSHCTRQRLICDVVHGAPRILLRFLVSTQRSHGMGKNEKNIEIMNSFFFLSFFPMLWLHCADVACRAVAQRVCLTALYFCSAKCANDSCQVNESTISGWVILH